MRSIIRKLRPSQNHDISSTRQHKELWNKATRPSSKAQVSLHWPDFFLGAGVAGTLGALVYVAGRWTYRHYYPMVPSESVQNISEATSSAIGLSASNAVEASAPALVRLVDLWKMLEEHVSIDLGALQLVGSALTLTVSYFYVRRRTNRAWQTRQFLSRVGFSFNEIVQQDGRPTLVVRTLLERDLPKVVLDNHHALHLVIAAAKEVTVEDPFLSLEPAEQWTINNFILNEISSTINPKGYLFAPPNSVSKWYVFGLTLEKQAGLYQSKLRVLIMEENQLQKLANHHVALPQLTSTFLSIRWQTLQKMAKLYEADKHADHDTEKRLGRVNIIV